MDLYESEASLDYILSSRQAEAIQSSLKQTNKQTNKLSLRRLFSDTIFLIYKLKVIHRVNSLPLFINDTNI